MASGLEGFNKLSKQLSDLGTRVGGNTLKRAMNKAVDPALQAARAAAPVSDRPATDGVIFRGVLRFPGFLKRNIGKKTFMSRDRTKGYAIVGPKPEAFYGTQWVELGTSRFPKKPWLEPAFNSSRRRMLSSLRESLKNEIKKGSK